jgi:two-component system chemotaxis response regulator CheB
VNTDVVTGQPRVLVVVAASAGGVEALQLMVAGLPPDMPAAVLVVLHLPRQGPSALPRILDRAGPLPAAHAVDGQRLRSGRIYVAPPGRHMLVVDGRIRLSHGPAENGHRPAADPLFRSAVRANDGRTVAVVVSGSRDDGTAGAAMIAANGGSVLVQDPDEALHGSMPRNVLERVNGVRSCPASKLGAVTAELVAALADEPAGAALAVDDDLAVLETAMASLDDLTTGDLPGSPAGLACPTCHGGLFELPGEPLPRYRCWVGHAWSPESLLDEQAAAFEGALWMALRSLEEKAALARRMGDDAQRRGYLGAADRYSATARDAEQASVLIRELIRRLNRIVEPEQEADAVG